MEADDGTGLRQLNLAELVSYAIGREKLTPLELELTLRLEEVMEGRQRAVKFFREFADDLKGAGKWE